MTAILQIIAIANAAMKTGLEIQGIVIKKPDGTIDVIAGFDEAGRRFRGVRKKVSDWRASNG